MYVLDWNRVNDTELERCIHSYVHDTLADSCVASDLRQEGCSPRRPTGP